MPPAASARGAVARVKDPRPDERHCSMKWNRHTLAIYVFAALLGIGLALIYVAQVH